MDFSTAIPVLEQIIPELAEIATDSLPVSETEISHNYLANWGLYGLFLICFLAATLIPFSSEIAVIAAIKMGFTAGEVLFWATSGNVLACFFNYFLGYFFRVKALSRLQKEGWGRKALQFWEKYGIWSLLLNWMPLIGDPLTVAAGIGRLDLRIFFAMVALLRFARYVVIVWVI